MRQAEVEAWLARIRNCKLSPELLNDCPLSMEGAEGALNATLDALTPPALEEAIQRPGKVYQTATMIAASTVFTAPLEWVAILLTLGAKVTLKRPVNALQIWDTWSELSGELPLTVTTDRSRALTSDLVVVMGKDQTITDVRKSLPMTTRMLGFGHRFSIAWVTEKSLPVDNLVPKEFMANWAGVAADLALHDSRGCMSPSLVFTTLPLATAVARLAIAMDLAQQVWPRGGLSEVEGAEIRTRGCLAKVGGLIQAGKGFSIHGIPAQFARPIALPRSVAVISVPDVSAALNAVRPFAAALSTVGTDDPNSADQWRQLGASRVCRIGRMQRPPLNRLHDGVDWLREIRRSD